MQFHSVPGFLSTQEFASNEVLFAVLGFAVIVAIVLFASRRAGPAALMLGGIAMMVLS